MIIYDLSYIKPILDTMSENPEKPAIYYKEQVVTYRELIRQAEAIAELLYVKGIQSGSVVGVCMDVTAVAPAVYLGIWMNGCVVLPLCTEDPPARHLAKIRTADIKVIFAGEKYMDLFAENGLDVICLSDQWMDFDEQKHDIPDEIKIRHCPYSYIIFTSGTTGEPKGILNTKENLFTHFISYAKMCNMSEHDVSLGCSPLYFDSVFEEIIAPLYMGGSILIPDEELKTDPDYLKEIIYEKQVSILSAPAPILSMLNEGMSEGESFPGLKAVVTGGDVLKYRDINHLLKVTKVYNGYGLSEATISSLWHRVEENDRNNIPIGKPIEGKKVYLLDDDLKPVKQGEIGNIYLGGQGVAVGYLNDSVLTKQKFVENPFGAEGERMVHTGDIGRELEDGSILFLGRKDRQISINGIRMELPEIENAIMQYKAVKDCCLVPFKTEKGDYLYAYIVAHSDAFSGISLRDMVEVFREYLPVSMLPRKFFQVDRIPRTGTGKVDLEALKTMDCRICRRDTENHREYNETEKKIRDIWAQVLNIEEDYIDIDSDLYELGADSLSVLRIYSKLKEVFGLQNIAKILKNKDTLGQQAETISFHLSNGTNSEIRIPKAKQTYYPITSSQKRMWIMSQLENNMALYNTLSLTSLVGDLDIQRFETALNKLMEDEPVLRTCFFEKEGIICQRPAEYSGFPIRYIALSEEKNAEEIINEYVERENDYQFDFKNEVPVRAFLFECSKRKHVFLLNVSHLVTDNVSWKVLLNKLNAYYRGEQAVSGDINYFDYAEFEMEYLNSVHIKEQLNYWVDKLAGCDRLLLDLQPYRRRPEILTSEGSSKRIVLEKDVLNIIKIIAQKEKITVYAYLLACFKILAHIYSCQDDIITGTPVVNRYLAGTEDMLGLFLNVVCIRNHINPNDSVAQFFQDVHRTVQEAIAHQDVPFENVVQAIQPERKLNQSPVFQILFDYHGNDTDIFRLDGIDVKDIPIRNHWAKNEISVTAIENAGELILDFEYNVTLYQDAFIEELLTRYKKLICNVSLNPDMPISGCLIMTEKDDTLIEQYNQQSAVYEKNDRLLHEIFQDIAAEYPDRTAFLFEDRKMTYFELNTRANRMARALLGYGVKPSDIVAICFEKSLELQVLIMALIKIGATYMALEPAHPAEHLNHMMDIAKPQFLISTVDKDIDSVAQEISYSDLEVLAKKESGENLTTLSSEDSILNIIFTSASTGKPKGVMTSVKAVINRLEWEWKQFPFVATDVMSHHKSYALIGSVWEMFGGLLTGIPTVIIPREHVLSGLLLKDIDRYNISHLFASPPILNALMKEKDSSRLSCTNFRFAVCSAEPIGSDFIDRWNHTFRNVSLINFYGSTEDCSDVAYYDTAELKAGASMVPAGKPVSCTRIYILDPFDNVLPVNVAGRVCVTGAAVSKGYINQEELTKKVFRRLKLRGKQEDAYITGDWGYISADGNLIILGRYDHLVKVRGYLVELSDVEMAIASIPGVKQAGVILAAEEDENKIAAYVALHPNQTIMKETIYHRLREMLPAYMLPAYITIVPEIPVTPNGKIDRIKMAEISRDTEVKSYFEARTPMERVIQEIWENILKRTRISIYDDFFVIGGDSLKAIQLIGHIRHIFGINYPLMELFSRANIAAMASYISAQKGSKTAAVIEKKDKQEMYPLAYVQEGFWFYNKLEPLNIFYNIAANRIQGTFNLQVFQKALNCAISRHDALRMVFGEQNGIPYIRIKDKLEITIPVIDLSGCEDKEREMLRLSREEINTPFDLEQGPLIRCKFFVYSEDDGVILINMHHIVTDGWSINILLEDISEYYNAYMENRKPVLKELQVSYSDFILWQRNNAFAALVEKQKAYWSEKLSGQLPVLGLMGRKKRPDLVTYNGEIIQFEISEEKTLQLKQLGYRYNSTLFMVLLSIYYITLYRYTLDEDIIIGSPIAGRGYPQIEDVIGCFINTLCIRSQCNGKMSFRDVIGLVRTCVIDAFSNSNLSFDELVNMLNPKRDVSRSPIFQSMMTMQDKPSNLFELSEGIISDAGVINDLAPYDLSVIVWIVENTATFYVEYYSDVFTRDFIEEFFADYRKIMDFVLERADKPIAEIPLMSKETMNGILDEWNQGNGLEPDREVAEKVNGYCAGESCKLYLLDEMRHPVKEGMVGKVFVVQDAYTETEVSGGDGLTATDIMAYYYEDHILHLKNGESGLNSMQEALIDKHSDETMAKVKSIWEVFLKRSINDLDSDFFSLGGNSLLLIQVLETLNEEFSLNITVMDLFRYTSLRKLSAFIDNSLNGNDAAESDKEKGMERRNVRRRTGRGSRK